MSESYQPEIEKLKNDFVNWCCTWQIAARPHSGMTAVEWALDEIGRMTLYYLLDKMKIRLYNGPRHGRQLVHAVVIDKDIMAKMLATKTSSAYYEILDPFRKQGLDDMHFIVPDAVRPQLDGSAVVEFWVDFDFRMPEAEE